MFSFLLQHRWRRLVRVCTTRSAGQIITAVLFIGLFLALAAGLCWALIAGLSAVQDDVFLRVALPYFLAELFLLVLCGLVGASALISGTFALFRQTGDVWFMVSPRYRQLLLSKALVVGVFSLWPLVVIALPLLIAMTVVYPIGAFGFGLGLLLVVLLGLLMTMGALTWLLGIGYLSAALARRLKRTTAFAWFLSGVALTIIGAAGFVWWQFRDLDVFTVFAVRDFSITEAPIILIASFFQSYPSHIAALGLYSLQTGAVAVAGFLSLLLGGLVLGVSALYALLGCGVLPLWQELQEARFVASAAPGNANPAFSQSGLVSAPSALGALVRKELLLLRRTPRDIAWLGFLLLLWVVVTSFDVFLVENVSATPLAALSAVEWIKALQFLVIIYFAAALTLRFAFPSMSVERDHVWALLSTPVDHARIFAAKALVQVGGVVLLTALITGLHLFILPTTWLSALSFLGFGLIASATVGLVGLGIGARYPNFDSADPQQLSTSLPGLAFMGLAIGYGGFSAYTLFQWFATDSLLFPLAFLAISLGCCWLVFTRVVRRLSRVEFVGVTHS